MSETAFDRLPPHSLESETALLGSCMIDEKAWSIVRHSIRSSDFYQADHAGIWSAISRLYTRGSKVDYPLLKQELLREGTFEEVGGIETIASILNSVPSSAHAEHYAADVLETSRRRQLIETSNEMLRAAYAPTHVADPAAEILQRTMERLAGIARNTGQSKSRPLIELMDEVREQMAGGGLPRVPTGFRDLDEITGGVGLGEMMLIGARPSMGKSTLAKQMAVRAAAAGIPTLLVSLEEGSHKMTRNILSAECKIDNHKLRRASLAHYEWDELDAGISRLRSFPLFMTDKSRRLPEIAAEAALRVQKDGVKLLVVDYLQRVQAGGRDAYEKAGAASTGLSDLIKELGVAGIVPVQLNRGVEHRDDKRPTTADLRDSGQIEQDADAIVFLHREDYYHLGEKEYVPNGIAELTIAKWRDGMRGGLVKLESNLRYQNFEDVAQEHETAPEEEFPYQV